MIFVTVGTTDFQFNRLTKVVNELATLFPNEKIVFQHGATKVSYTHKNVVLCKEVPFDQMITFLKKARVIIAQGGPATIYLANAAGKVPYVLPRLQRYHEHVNNHQLEYSQFLSKKKKIVLLREPINLKKLLSTPSKKISLKPFANNSLTAYLTAVIDGDAENLNR